MRVLVTGAAGRLGSELVKYFGSEHSIIGTFRTTQRDLPISCGTAVKVDLVDESAVLDMIAETRPDLVVHCAAASSVDRCQLDSEFARLNNVVTTQNLCQAISHVGRGRFFYISTDYVFDGATKAPEETEPLQPMNTYGESKRDAELATRKAGIEFAILRVCALYTAGAHPKGDPITAIAETIKRREVYKAATDLFSNPTEVSDVARAIAALAKLPELPESLHIAAPEYMTRHEFAIKVAERLNLDRNLIEAVTCADLNLPAPRPLKAGLGSARFEALMGYSLKSFDSVPGISR